ncbi:MAG: LemA family protein, partial [Deltaproteobacteria bacterium]|nr:LemA family protein [Deltaproteobacteria bacterium]
MKWVVLAVLVLAVLWVIWGYNLLVSLRNRVQNGWKQIDVQLKRRHDLIPNLVEAVKGYMKFEQDTLQKVMEARAKAVGSTGVQATAAAENILTQSLGRIFALMENYPELKANENVLRLQEELTTTENQIAFARQYYNDLVMRFNVRQEV